MASGNIAASKKFTSNGEKKEQTLFVNIKFFGRSAEVFNQYCKKGSHILIDGELANNNWTDQNGNKRYDFEVHVSTMQMLGTTQTPTQKRDNQEYGDNGRPLNEGEGYGNSQPPIHYENVPK